MGFPYLQAGIAGVGLLGSLLGGGRGASQTTTVSRQLSPEQRMFLNRLQGEMGRPAYDLTDIVRSTRERVGAESSALRTSAMQRLQRSGVPGLQQESVLADITTSGLRQLGSSIADLEFQGLQASEERRQNLLRVMAGMLSGLGSQTQTTTGQGESGLGFAQLFGTGLQGLMDRGDDINALFRRRSRGVGTEALGSRIG